MSWTCPRCQLPVYFAEKVSSLGKNWHPFCLKCERCHSILSPGGHEACHFPQPPTTAFSPGGPPKATTETNPKATHLTMGGRIATSHVTGLSSDPGVRVNIGGVGSYLYNPPTHTPASSTSLSPSSFSPPRPRTGLPQGKKSPPHMKTFTGETSLCPGCGEPVYFAEKVMSLGRNWHRPCLRCQRCQKTLTAGSHAEHDGLPYCHVLCYGCLFGPKGVNIGDVGCYIYDPAEMKSK